MASSDAKRRRTDSPIQGLQQAHSEIICSHESSSQVRIQGGLITTDHIIQTALDYSGEHPGQIEIFAREVIASNKKGQESSLPCICFLAGGPGFSSPRPSECPAWVRSATTQFRVILLDQRGTGQSSPITTTNLANKGTPSEQARYLSFFRADSIVRDAEVVRKALVPSESFGGRWSLLGQSYGGFCSTTYLSLAPSSLIEVLMTGGIPPNVNLPCTADLVYCSLFRRVVLQNQRYYERFPQDAALVREIVSHLGSQPQGGIVLPSGSILTPRSFQLLGLGALGMAGGFERLHFMLEGFFDSEGLPNPCFVKSFEQQMPWDTNPLYVLLHESIYCQPGGVSAWSAHRIRQEPEFRDLFDAEAAASNGRAVFFTGEMVFPWMFDDFASLRPYKEAADLIANKKDWGRLYHPEVLSECRTPVAAAVYYEDMYVDVELSKPTFDSIRGMRQWVTNEYKHSGLRDDGAKIFDRLISMVRDVLLVD